MSVDDLRDFVLAGLADDERRVAEGHLSLLDEAETLGRLRFLRTDDGRDVLLAAGGASAPDDVVPFEEKADLVRAEAERADDAALRLIASVYENRAGWQEEWRTYV